MGSIRSYPFKKSKQKCLKWNSVFDKKLMLYPNKNSIHNEVIEVLSEKFPLRINEIHKIIQKKGIIISYQGVKRVVNDLEEQGYLTCSQKRYLLNRDWLFQALNSLERIKKHYSLNEAREYEIISIFNKDNNYSVHGKTLTLFLSNLIPMFRQAFEKHNIFSKSDEYVNQYLYDLQKQYQLMVFLASGKISGAVFVLKENETSSESFIHWKLRHFVCLPELPEGGRIAFLNMVKGRIAENDKLNKIRYNLAENEGPWIKVFKRAGFSEEAVLPDKYRLGENVFVYSIYIGSKQ